MDPATYLENVEVRAGEMRAEQRLAFVVAAVIKGSFDVFELRVVALAERVGRG
jgi:hypothetical protein